MPALPDLITVDRALAEIDVPSAGDVAVAARWVTAASACARSYTQQRLSYAVHDEIHGAKTFGEVVVRQVPIAGPVTIRTRPQPVLILSNNNPAYPQSWASLATSGDPVQGFTATGLNLTYVANGVPTTLPTLTFASYPTLAQLAAAVKALGNGWGATVGSGLGLWPSTDLRAPQGNQSTSPGVGSAYTNATFFVHTAFTNGFVQVPDGAEAGIINFQVDWSRDVQWAYYFPEASPEMIVDAIPFAMGICAYRIIYPAGYWCETQSTDPAYPGYPTLPEDLADAVALIVRANLAKRKALPLFMNRSLGDFSYTIDPALSRAYIPADAREILDRYRDPFCHLST